MRSTRAITSLLLLACAGPLAAQPPQLRLKSGRLPPDLLRSGTAGPSLARAVTARRAEPARVHLLIQFTEPTTDELDTLGMRDVRVLQYMPDHAVVASAPVDVDLTGLDVQFMGLLEASDKLSAQLDLSGDAADVTAVMEVHLDIAASVARRIAAESGLTVIEQPDLPPTSLLVRGAAQALRTAASWDEVAYIYPAADVLLRGEPVLPCLGGVSTIGELNGAANLASSFGDGWDGPGLGPATLAYWIGALPSWLDQAAARAELLRALDAWAAVVQVRFQESSVQKLRRQIEIFGATGSHGDGFSFDGRGGVLAHTFYPPPNTETNAGDLHLDLDEPWRIGADVDLFSVALHELGHALGLGHNDDADSVMYPYYRRVSGLRPADIAEIRKLYAAAGVNTPSTPMTPATPDAPPAPPANPSTDKVAPSLKITYPATPTSSTNAASITVRGSATDNTGVVGLTWSTSSASGSGTPPFGSFSAGPIPLAPGLNLIAIQARDAAGNTSWRSISVTRR